MADLNDMMLFLAVVEAGSFTLAAERLAMPKANLSRKVSRLEQQLGVTLLERTTRSQTLTESGQLFLTHCRRIQEEKAQALAVVSEALKSVKGSLKLGASVAIGHHVLKDKLRDFLDQYPDITLQLNLLNQRVDLIEEGFDMVIRIGKLDDSRLVAKHLGTISRRLYASQRYLDQTAKRITVDSLDQHNVLLMRPMQSRNQLTLQKGDSTQTIKVIPRLVTDDLLIIKQGVVDGLGIAVLPDYLCREAFEQGLIRPVCKPWCMPPVEIYAVYPKNRTTLPKVSALLTFIQTLFADKLKNCSLV